jgi:hypothetical protein
MASVVHFKFKNARDSASIQFDGPVIALPELKRRIMQLTSTRDVITEDLIVVDSQSSQGLFVCPTFFFDEI